MSYLAVKVREYVSRPGVTALGLEKKADVPVTTISNILRDSHPRPERLGQLLQVLPAEIAQEWLTAYLRDDVPPEWQHRVEILIDTTSLASHVAEDPTLYGIPNTQAAMEQLTAAMEHDPELGRWFVKTVSLILGVPLTTQAQARAIKALA